MDAAEKSIASMPAILEKLSVLDKWLNTRMEQTRAAEARMESKLQQLTRLEGSLSTMIDGLRRQMGEIAPQIASASLVADQAKEQAAAAVDSVIADALAHVRQESIRVAHQTAESIEQQIAGKIDDGLRSMSVERMAQLSADVQLQLVDEADRCRDRAEQTLILFRQVLAQQVIHLADEARHAVDPHLAKIGDTREAVDREVNAILDAATETVQQRLAHLCKNANNTVELLEKQLVERVRMIRPQAMTEIESTQKLIAHRVAGLIEASRKMVGNVVNELDQQLDSLSPKADAVRQELDEKLAEYLREMETEASTMLGWLEDRITGRVDDLVDLSRRSMHNELRALDDAAKQLRRPRPVAPMPAAEHPGEPLSLSLYLHRDDPTRPKPAA
jgi:hypothetical protein